MSEPQFQLSPSQFEEIREQLHRFSGVVFRDEAHFLFERRLGARCKQLGLAHFDEYCALLAQREDDPGEIEQTLDALLSNETYFFREEAQLRAFVMELLPVMRDQLRAANRDSLRIWSAGCSTGEEAYSIAILTHESMLFDGWTVEVVGTDISSRVVQHAQRAEYGESSFRALSEAYTRYFSLTPEGRRVVEPIRERCRFVRHNLMDGINDPPIEKADAIFCRNVMIYLSDESRKRVLATFFDMLEPGGFLLLGHSESLLNTGSEFKVVRLRSELVYQKPFPLRWPL